MIDRMLSKEKKTRMVNLLQDLGNELCNIWIWIICNGNVSAHHVAKICDFCLGIKGL